jgi:hypothetical protein
MKTTCLQEISESKFFENLLPKMTLTITASLPLPQQDQQEKRQHRWDDIEDIPVGRTVKQTNGCQRIHIRLSKINLGIWIDTDWSMSFSVTTLRSEVLNRGQRLSRNVLDPGLQTDQLLHEETATEYNKKGVDEYDRVQWPMNIVNKNLPSNFTDVEWNTVKRIWKDFTYQLEKAIAYKNRLGNNDSSGQEEVQGIENFSRCHSVSFEENPMTSSTRPGRPRL